MKKSDLTKEELSFLESIATICWRQGRNLHGLHKNSYVHATNTTSQEKASKRDRLLGDLEFWVGQGHARVRCTLHDAEHPSKYLHKEPIVFEIEFPDCERCSDAGISHGVFDEEISNFRSIPCTCEAGDQWRSDEPCPPHKLVADESGEWCYKCGAEGGDQ